MNLQITTFILWSVFLTSICQYFNGIYTQSWKKWKAVKCSIYVKLLDKSLYDFMELQHFKPLLIWDQINHTTAGWSGSCRRQPRKGNACESVAVIGNWLVLVQQDQFWHWGMAPPICGIYVCGIDIWALGCTLTFLYLGKAPVSNGVWMSSWAPSCKDAGSGKAN